MNDRKELFVLVVAGDRMVAAALRTVLRAGGYMVGTTGAGASAARIAGRMVVDAAVIDLAAHQPLNLEAAIALRDQYPACRIILICSPSQRDEALMLAEETSLVCTFLKRPLSRVELLAEVGAAPGVRGCAQTSGWRLQAA